MGPIHITCSAWTRASLAFIVTSALITGACEPGETSTTPSECPSGVFDDCGSCDGDGASCADCAGVPNGLAVKDNCDTCDDDDANDCTQDCAETWGGAATVDNCDTCDDDPTNDCTQDCAEVWGGAATVDNCDT
jgi:hypothetical protein